MFRLVDRKQLSESEPQAKDELSARSFFELSEVFSSLAKRASLEKPRADRRKQLKTEQPEAAAPKI